MKFGAFFRGVLCLALFVLGLCGGCWAIREALPFPEVALVKPKIMHFAAHHDDYDTLFLGSSRIYYQIIPALFDRLAAEQGLPTRSFNAAIAGMRPPEDAYYLDYLLRSPPKKLRWVFIELAGLRTAVDRDKIGTVRAVYWHDWARLCVLFKRALVAKPDTKKRKWQRTLENRLEPFGDFFDHVPLFIQNQTNLGRASLLTSRLTYDGPRPTPAPRATLGEDLAGWIPTGRPEVMAGAELASFDKALAERRVTKPLRDPGDPVSQLALETMIAKVEKLGATPVLIVPPTTNKRNFVPSREREAETIVLDFCDLEKFPELYEHRYRLDTDHLNTAGAEVFTRTFVKTWADEVNRRR
ncbi:MAG: hypothetical protein WCF18_06340 [Chthoniobacteraceae bacterium]